MPIPVVIVKRLLGLNPTILRWWENPGGYSALEVLAKMHQRNVKGERKFKRTPYHCRLNIVDSGTAIKGLKRKCSRKNWWKDLEVFSWVLGHRRVSWRWEGVGWAVISIWGTPRIAYRFQSLATSPFDIFVLSHLSRKWNVTSWIPEVKLSVLEPILRNHQVFWPFQIPSSLHVTRKRGVRSSLSSHIERFYPRKTLKKLFQEYCLVLAMRQRYLLSEKRTDRSEPGIIISENFISKRQGNYSMIFPRTKPRFTRVFYNRFPAPLANLFSIVLDNSFPFLLLRLPNLKSRKWQPLPPQSNNRPIISLFIRLLLHLRTKRNRTHNSISKLLVQNRLISISIILHNFIKSIDERFNWWHRTSTSTIWETS